MNEESWINLLFAKFYEHIANPDMWVTISWSTLQIILIVVASRILIAVITAIVNRIFRERKSSTLQMEQRRVETLRVLVNNVARYTVYFIMIMMILYNLGIDLRPVLVSAGVLGLAVGFGAQSLVRDIISGFFIIFEDQFSVGDIVTVNTFYGTVQEIGLRITKIKSWTGELYIIPNGSITEVTNYSIHNSLAVIDVSVTYEENIDHVIKILEEVANKLKVENEDMVADPQVLGVQALGVSDVVVRLVAECKPTTHFAIARKLRSMIKEEFIARGMEIPYPKTVYMTRDNKNVKRDER